MQYILSNWPYLLLAILAFGILVLWHELGHFLLAKANGIKVEEFSIGMGKKVFGFKRKETEYNLRIAPIGGFVRMLGEEGTCDDERAFGNKKAWQRLTVVAAGPIFNFILAVILFAIVISQIGTPVPVIDKVQEKTPAAVAGIQSGDELKEVNGEKIISWNDFLMVMSTNKGEEVDVKVDRSGKIENLTLKPILLEEENRYIVGITAKMEKPGIIGSIKYGVTETISTVKQTVAAFVGIFTDFNKDSIGGPVTIFKMSTEVAKVGILNLVMLMAFLSVQLAIFNIIPFPALDGGWITILIIEMIIGKKLDENKVGFVNYIGFILLLGLMAVVTLKDIFFPMQLP